MERHTLQKTSPWFLRADCDRPKNALMTHGRKKMREFFMDLCVHGRHLDWRENENRFGRVGNHSNRLCNCHFSPTRSAADPDDGQYYCLNREFSSPSHFVLF